MSVRLRDDGPLTPPLTPVCLVRDLLENQRDLDSDSGGDEDDFVPSRQELESSEDEDEAAAAASGADSDQEVSLKRGRRPPPGRTPRSKQRRTPRKTPSKVKLGEGFCCPIHVKIKEEQNIKGQDQRSVSFLVPFPVSSGPWDAADASSR